VYGLRALCARALARAALTRPRTTAKGEQTTARTWQRMRNDVAAELVQAGDYVSTEAALQDRGIDG
jgi:hypothetical protein